MLSRTPSLLLRALAVAAVVCVLVPTCSMAAMCTMEMDLAATINCDSMWFSSDAESGVLVSLLTLAVLAVFTGAIAPRTLMQAVPLFAAHRAVGPHPPSDPLVGRLRV
jgi:hypothetical protein